MPEGAAVLHLDRNGALEALRGLRVDHVFDICAHAPGQVAALLAALGTGVGRDVLASSVSVSGDYSRPGLDESVPVPTATDADLAVAAGVPAAERSRAFAYGASYGPLKRACECVALERLGDRALILRAGLLVGAGDYTDRLTWWARRIDEGGRVPALLPHDRAVQMIDVRDAAAFAVRAAATGRQGLYNLTGPVQTLGDVLQTICDASGSGAELVWLDKQSFDEAGILPWPDLPPVVADGSAFARFLEVGTVRAQDDGLTCRPLRDTVAGLLVQDRTDRARPLKCGIPPEKLARLPV
jgi:2'-hydroxyisoflavone reductase